MFNDPWRTGCFILEIKDGKPIAFIDSKPDMFVYRV